MAKVALNRIPEAEDDLDIFSDLANQQDNEEMKDKITELQNLIETRSDGGSQDEE